MDYDKIKGGRKDCYHLFHKYFIVGAMPIYKCRCGAYYFNEDKEVTPRCKFTGKVYNEYNPLCCFWHRWLGWLIDN